MTLDDIRKIDRRREPPIEGLMCDLLWADPQVRSSAPKPDPTPLLLVTVRDLRGSQEPLGRAPSKRGVSCMFGPDVTARFLDDNGLDLLVSVAWRAMAWSEPSTE